MARVTVEVRPVLPEEYEAAGRVVVAAYAALPSPTEMLAGGYGDELADVGRRVTGAEVFVAVAPTGEGATEVLGCVTLVTNCTSPWAELLREGEAGVRMMGVRPDAQHQGIGRALLNACLERALQLGRSAVLLHSTPWMDAAHVLYESSGFVREPDRDWLPVPEVPLLAFRREIG